MSSPSSETGPLGRLRQFLSFLGPAQQAAPTKKSIHFGGGNIGRGFVAEFLHKSGYEVVFVDVMDSLIEKLQNATSYKVIELGSDANDQHTFVIDNFRAINSKHEGQKVIDEISTADTVTCAVGPNILKFIAEPIAKGILARKESSPPLAVIACENMIGATTALKELILSKVQPEEKAIIERNARFANSAIDRIVPKQDPDAGLDVKIEKFYEWCVESEPFQGQVPDIQGVHFVDNLEPYIERKLYTVNTAHATAAYYGYNRGKTFIHEAMKDAEIRQLVVDTLEETAALIVEKHGIAKDEQQRYVDNILERISAEFFEDEATRVGRAPIRKLGLKERFVGPAKQISKRGGSYSHLLGGIEMALRFQNVQGDDESAELARLLAEAKDEQGGAERITEQLTGLNSDEYQQLYGEVVDIVKRVQADLS